MDLSYYTPKINEGDPFFNDLGSKAVISLESGFPTLRTDWFNVEENNHLLLDSLNVAEERREVVTVKMAYYQHKLKQMYDKGVKSRPLAPRDLILRKMVGTAKNPVWGKLSPNLEWPYRITSITGIGAYYLEDLNENVIPHLWNINNLQRYYY